MAAAFVEQNGNVHVGVRDERLDLDCRCSKRLPGIDVPGQRARNRQEPVDEDRRDVVHLDDRDS